MDFRQARIDFSFEGNVEIIDWIDDQIVATLPITDGLSVMSASTRWDTTHATISVRKLNELDAERLELPSERPYKFRIRGLTPPPPPNETAEKVLQAFRRAASLPR